MRYGQATPTTEGSWLVSDHALTQENGKEQPERKGGGDSTHGTCSHLLKRKTGLSGPSVRGRCLEVSDTTFITMLLKSQYLSRLFLLFTVNSVFGHTNRCVSKVKDEIKTEKHWLSDETSSAALCNLTQQLTSEANYPPPCNDQIILLTLVTWLMFTKCGLTAITERGADIESGKIQLNVRWNGTWWGNREKANGNDVTESGSYLLSVNVGRYKADTTVQLYFEKAVV